MMEIKGEQMQYRSANTRQEARLGISATGF